MNSAPWGSAIRRTPGAGRSRFRVQPCAWRPRVGAETKHARRSSGSNRLAVERTARVSRWDNGLVLVVRPVLGLGLTAAIAVAAAGVGIAVAAAGEDIDSGIVGRVLCPVVLERSPGCSDLMVVVRERSSNRRLATVKPNRLGRFTVALEPGVYLIEVQPRPARAAPTAVRVLPHRFAHPVLAAWPTARPADARQLFQR